MAYHMIDNHETCPVIILTDSDAEAWLDRKFPPKKAAFILACDTQSEFDYNPAKFEEESREKAAKKQKMYAEQDKKLARELRAERTAYIKLHEAKLGVRETTHTKEAR